jgi:hypothetical protein
MVPLARRPFARQPDGTHLNPEGLTQSPPAERSLTREPDVLGADIARVVGRNATETACPCPSARPLLDRCALVRSSKHIRVFRHERPLTCCGVSAAAALVVKANEATRAATDAAFMPRSDAIECARRAARGSVSPSREAASTGKRTRTKSGNSGQTAGFEPRASWKAEPSCARRARGVLPRSEARSARSAASSRPLAGTHGR